MSMESGESRATAPLAHRVAKDASAAQVGDAMVATWQEIGTALTPIVGQRGVAALYKRSLHLASAAHPWLAGAHEGGLTAMEPAALKSVFANQTGADAAAGARALLQTFDGLLASLVGASLTERLLRPVWANSMSGPPAQDTPA